MTETTMSIRIELDSPTPEGRLLPTYLEDVDFLRLASPSDFRGGSGVTLDGTILFRLDTQRRLRKAIVHRGKRSWRVEENFPEPPRDARAADIKFTPETIEAGFFSLPHGVRVSTDGKKERVLVTLDESKPSEVSIELSESCFALVDGDRLVGFYVSLA
jgi:hypothetical protein